LSRSRREKAKGAPRLKGHNGGGCLTCGKVSYRSKGEAGRAASFVRRRAGGETLRAYWSERCRCYHIARTKTGR
jgi:hypothetical protein